MDNINVSIIILGFIGGIIILIRPFIGLLIVSALIPRSLIPAVTGTFLGLFSMATPIKIAGTWTFVASFIRHGFKRKSWDFLKRPQIKFFILLLIWILISGLVKPCSFTRENFTVFISFMVLGFIILFLVNNLKRFRGVIWAGSISIFIISLQTLFDYSKLEQTLRMHGTSYGPNYFAVVLLPFLGIVFYNIFAEKVKILKIFSLLTTITISAALIVTFSRAGLIGFTGMLAVAAVGAKRKLRAFLGLIICIIILLNVMPVQVWERFGQTQATIERLEETSNIDSTKRRFLLSKAAWEMFLEYPLFGVGIGNYYWECNKYQSVSPGRAHSMYLEILAELGIFGFFFFVGILFHTFRALKRIAIKATGPVSSYAQGLYIGLVGFLISAIFLHAQQEKVLWFVIFMAAALEQIAFSNENLRGAKS